MPSIVTGFFFLAKTTGSPITYPVMMAGAMPLASMVMILSAPANAKRRANSSATRFIRTGSIWWFIKLSTFNIPPSRHLPSLSIRSFSASI